MATGDQTIWTMGSSTPTVLTTTSTFQLNTQGFPGILEPPEPDPCLAGHVLSGELVEYIDGVNVGHCTECNCRVTLGRVPGGISLMRIKALLGGLMSLDPDAVADQEHFDGSELLGMFAELRDQLGDEEFALEEARELLDISRRLLTKKLRVDA